MYFCKNMSYIFRYWFPEKAYDDVTAKMVPTNISEWTIQISHSIECQEGERPEVVFNAQRFMLLKDGSLYVHDHNKVIPPLDFCVEHELGN